MKTIDEINRDDYNSFHLTDESSNFALQFNTPSGLIDESDYDLIQSQAGVIVGYKKNIQGIHNYVYTINGVQKRLQNLLYDAYKPILDEEKIGTFDVYSFVNSVPISQNNNFNATTDGGDEFIRCDYDKFGGLPFYSGGAAFGILQVKNILDVSGSAHVLLIHTTNDGFFTSTSQVRNCSAKTFTGILKNIYEWSLMADSPFNSTETTAVKAKQMWNSLDIPQNLLDWILNNQPDMQVSRFLKGEIRLAYDIDENTEIPQELKDYVILNSRYRTLTGIKNTHPRGNLIEEKLIEKEKFFFEKEIFNFCLFNNILDMSDENIEAALSQFENNVDAKYYYELYKGIN